MRAQDAELALLLTRGRLEALAHWQRLGRTWVVVQAAHALNGSNWPSVSMKTLPQTQSTRLKTET